MDESDLPEEEDAAFSRLIGDIAVTYNLCQGYVFRIFWSLSGMTRERATAVFFSVRSDSSQRDMTKAIITSAYSEEGDGEIKQQIFGTVETLSKLSGARNAAIHTIWEGDADFKTLSRSPMMWGPIAKPLRSGQEIKVLQKLLEDLNQAQDMLLLSFVNTLARQQYRP